MEQQIKLEIETESYEKVYSQLQALYEIANKASLAIEKATKQKVDLVTFGLAGFGLGLLVGIFLVTI